MSFLALNTYLMDSFKYAASAIAATTVARSIAGAFFPLVCTSYGLRDFILTFPRQFGQAMFDRLGLGWGNSLLAFIALVLGTVYPVFLWYYVSVMSDSPDAIPERCLADAFYQGPAIRARGKSDR